MTKTSSSLIEMNDSRSSSPGRDANNIAPNDADPPYPFAQLLSTAQGRNESSQPGANARFAGLRMHIAE